MDNQARDGWAPGQGPSVRQKNGKLGPGHLGPRAQMSKAQPSGDQLSGGPICQESVEITSGLLSEGKKVQMNFINKNIV